MNDQVASSMLPSLATLIMKVSWTVTKLAVDLAVQKSGFLCLLYHLCSSFLFKYFYYFSIKVVPIFPHYSPLPYPPPTPTFNPRSSLSLSMGPLYMFLDLTVPLLSPISFNGLSYFQGFLKISVH